MKSKTSYDEKYVNISETLKIHYFDSSVGNITFLLVHGLSSNLHLFDGVASELMNFGYRVITLDQRGHGGSCKPDSGYDFDSITNDLKLFIDSVGIREHFVLVGQSWGGNVVLDFASRYHLTNLIGVCLIDGGFLNLSKAFQSWEDCKKVLTPPNLEGIQRDDFEKLIRNHHPAWPESGINGTLENFEILKDNTIRPWLNIDNHLLILKSLYEHNPNKVAETVTVPVLIVPASPSKDEIQFKKDGLAEIDGILKESRTKWFFESDHDIHAEHPHELALLLHESLEQNFFKVH